MPKPIAAFTCDVCQQIHSTENEAAICEQRHGNAVVTEIVYAPGKVYPEEVKITVTHANGETRNFTFM